MSKECFSDVLVTRDFLPATRQGVMALWATNVHFTNTAINRGGGETSVTLTLSNAISNTRMLLFIVQPQLPYDIVIVKSNLSSLAQC